MHRCLMIPEILLTILDALPRLSTGHMLLEMANWVEIPSTSNHADALAIALTCKTFLEPGLDALWSTMYSLKPLVTLSVPDGWPDSYVRQITLSPDLGMDRFTYYARRIRVLRSWDRAEIPAAWRWLSVSARRQSQPILPNLRHLKWKHEGPETFPYVSLFAGPLLQSLMLDPREVENVHDDSVFSSLSTLTRLSPMLSRLVVNDDYIDPDQESYLQTILSLSALQLMTSVYLITPASYEVIRQLSYMPHLRSLGVELYGRRYELPDISTKLNFVCLQELVLKSGDLDVMTLVLGSPSDQLKIQTISIETLECESAPAIDELIKAVCRVCSAETLTSFNLGTDPFRNEHPPSDSVTNNATLFPLFKFRRMESFSLSVCNPDWDDHLLEGISSAWPNLQLLVLLRHGGEPSGFTFKGLVSLAQGCPRLKHLDLLLAPWNANVGGTALRSSKESVRRSPFHIVLRYPLPNLEAEVESYLRLVFPNLSQLDIVHEDGL